MTTPREDREKERLSRETLGKFFYDIAKATFTIMVLTNTVAMFTSANFILAVILFVTGMIATVVLARIGYSIIKK